MVHTSDTPRCTDLSFPAPRFKSPRAVIAGQDDRPGYNLVGSLASETYPSGRVVNTCYNAANEVVQVGLGACSTTSGAYASGVLYAPQGQPGSYTYGNQLGSTRTYNNRLQPSGFTNTAGSTVLLSAALDRGTSNNNGNLLNSTYIYNGGAGLSNPLTLKQSYTYDGVNRLLGVTDTGYTRTFGYDQYGNSYVSNATGIAPLPNTPASPGLYDANNQLTSGSYDAAGNETSVNGNTITYDAESHQVNVVGSGVNETYAYDGDGKRVGKLGNGGVPTTVFIYDAMGRMAAEYTTTVASSPCVTCYLSTDDLGTVRLITSESDAVVARHDYLPFGEEVLANTAGRNSQWGTGNDPINQKFTGKERDSESGLDYFGARYYGSALERFTSPDKVNVTDRRLESPTVTLNKYGYGGSNPLKYVDPDGEDITIFYEGGLPGHTILLAYNQQTGQSGLRSFGPDHSQVGMAHTASGLPVASTDRFGLADVKSVDYLRQHFASITIQTSPEEAQKVLETLIEHPDGNYTTYWNNCTTTCAQLLRDIGKFEDHPLTPVANFSLLYYKYGNRAATDNFWGTSFNNGSDYGKYKPSYNPFDLLFKTINCTKYTWTATNSDGKVTQHSSDTVCQ